MCLTNFMANPSSTPKHLFKQDTAINFSHKYKITNRGHVNSSCQQIDCYRNIGILIVFKLLNDLQNLLFIASSGLSSDLHNSII